MSEAHYEHPHAFAETSPTKAEFTAKSAQPSVEVAAIDLH